jgi:manganese/zinc/iron transport system substrate-binding protein
MADTLTKVGRTKPVFAVSEELDPTSLLTPEGAEGHKDPHVWMNPLLWAKCAEAVARRLGEYDPVNRQMYLENAAKFVEECEVLHRYGTKVLATIPEKSRVLISSHDAFNYFGKAFGIEVLGVQGLSTESEAGLQRINQLVDLIVAREVAAVFVESSVSSKSVEALVAGVKARGRTLRIGGELFSDAMGATGTYEGTYVGMLEHNITLVARGLGGDAPKTGFSGKLSHVP